LDSAAELPVLVWVHGGSNKGGWSYEPNYIGTKLAAKGVIVVTISYQIRLADRSGLFTAKAGPKSWSWAIKSV
jgi:acetyl esterase/lipase